MEQIEILGNMIQVPYNKLDAAHEIKDFFEEVAEADIYVPRDVIFPIWSWLQDDTNYL